jgi:hypothetical protein
MRRQCLVAGTLFLTLAVVSFFLMGCMTKMQMEAESAYYKARVDIAKERQSQPIFRMTPIEAGQPIIITNGTVEVFAQPQNSDANFAQYQHRDFTPAWIPSLLNAAAPLGILYGGSLLIKAMPNSGGNITNQNSGNTTSTSTALSNTVSGSNNAANLGSGSTHWTNTLTTEAPVVIVP